MDPIEILVNTIIHGYAVVVAFIIGWSLPRGNNMRMVQLWILRKVHNFLAREDEKIVEKIEEKKKQIRKTKSV